MGRIWVSKGGPGRQRGWGRWRGAQWRPWRSSPPPPRTSLPPKSIINHHVCWKHFYGCFFQLFERNHTNLPDYYWLSSSEEGQQDEVDRESSANKNKEIYLMRIWTDILYLISHSEGPDAGHCNDDGKAGNGWNSKSDPVHCCRLMSSQENPPLHETWNLSIIFFTDLISSLWLKATTHPNVSISWKEENIVSPKFPDFLPDRPHLHRNDGVDLLDEPPPDTLVAEGHLPIPTSLKIVGILTHLPHNSSPLAPQSNLGLSRLWSSAGLQWLDGRQQSSFNLTQTISKSHPVIDIYKFKGSGCD